MGIILGLIAVLWFAGTIAQMSSFTHYSDTYKRLVDGTAVFDYEYEGLYYFCNPTDKGSYVSEIVVFTSGSKFSDIKVGPWEYIHGGLLAWISPYSLYWWFKYKDWFEKNKENFVNQR